MVFGSTLLEVAIGVVFVYLLLSMLCSALSELIESFLKYRARDLEKGIGKLLDNPQLAQQFFNHPLIKPLGEKPSYIPARTFSLALWNLATTPAGQAKAAAVGVTQDLSAIRNLIASLDEKQFGNIRISLLALIDEAGGDINKARANIEDWYDDAMDRVSGWYKRRVHKILILIGLIAAALLNVDTINVTKALWYNDTLRTSVVTAADNYVKTSPTPTATPQNETPTQQTGNPEAQASSALEKIDNIRGEINKLGLPVGWLFQPEKTDNKYEGLKEPQLTEQYQKDLKSYIVDPRRFPNDIYGWFLKLMGIFLTALAVSQGAPFWFDLLNKIIVIRSTIKPHEKSPDQPSKDRPAPETTKKQEEVEEKEGEDKG